MRVVIVVLGHAESLMIRKDDDEIDELVTLTR